MPHCNLRLVSSAAAIAAALTRSGLGSVAVVTALALEEGVFVVAGDWEERFNLEGRMAGGSTSVAQLVLAAKKDVQPINQNRRSDQE